MSYFEKKSLLMPIDKPVEITSELSIQEIQDKTYVVIHRFPWSCNSLFVETKNGQLILVDTPNTPEATGILLDWINQRYKSRIITAYNSHFHFDCLGGNQTLIENNIKIYGTELTAAMIKERGELVRDKVISWLTGPENQHYREVYKEIPYIAPIPLEDLDVGHNMDFGGEKVEIFYPGKAHAPDNLVFYFPDKRLLFGGCMLLSLEARQLGNLDDADLILWLQSIHKIIDRYPDIDIIIPGHGAWGGRELLEHTLDIVKSQIT